MVIFVHNIHLLGETQKLNAQGCKLIAKGVVSHFQGLMFFVAGCIVGSDGLGLYPFHSQGRRAIDPPLLDRVIA
jgi:hypothetical protein